MKFEEYVNEKLEGLMVRHIIVLDDGFGVFYETPSSTMRLPLRYMELKRSHAYNRFRDDNSYCPICGQPIGFIDPIYWTKKKTVIVGQGKCPTHGSVELKYTFSKKVVDDG